MGTPDHDREPALAGRRRFETTQWTVVLAAADGDDREARQALAALCQSYWPPVYAYLRARGFEREEAEDLTQGFFTRLIEKDALRHARRERGRFRSFLLASLKHYLANEWDRERAKKRGGGQSPLRLEPEAVERRLPVEPATWTTPEDVFLRHWALTVLERAMASLGAEMRRRGQEAQFGALKDLLTGEGGGARYRDVAVRLHTTEGAVKVRVHRLRRRFGELLRDEVAGGVSSPAEVEEELTALLGAVAA
jgi:RNA polymerase sigma-70 factor (ECF subfamily)